MSATDTDSFYALSLWTPWTVAIVGSTEIPDGFGKLIENRERWTACHHRGPLLLHAAQGFGGLDAFDGAMRTMLQNRPDPRELEASFTHRMRGVAVPRKGPRGPYWRPGPELVRGAIVGRCVLDGEITNDAEFASYASQVSGAEEQRKWWFGGFALVFRDVERLTMPIPYKGGQKLFKVPKKVLEGARWESVQRRAA